MEVVEEVALILSSRKANCRTIDLCERTLIAAVENFKNTYRFASLH